MAKPGTTWVSNDGKFTDNDRNVVEQYDLKEMILRHVSHIGMTSEEVENMAGEMLVHANEYLEFFKSVAQPDLTVRKY